MPEKIKFSKVYERLVSDDRDLLGQVAYSIYKIRKRDFIMQKQAETGKEEIDEETISDFVNAQSDYTLELYREQAKNIFREFLNASYENELTETVQQLEQEYNEKYAELAKNTRPHSWWYGVGQSFTASFLFLLAGYILLKMSGSWDTLLNNLFK